MRIAVALLAAYVPALVWLLWTAGRDKKRYALAKGVCSALFLTVALWGGFTSAGAQSALFPQLVLALLLCAFGDVLLGVANQRPHRLGKRPFVAGALSFMLAHVVFCVYLYHIAAPRWWDAALPAVLVASLLLLEKSGRVRLKKMKLLGVLYTVCVALMASKAAQAPWFWGFTPGAVLLCSGALLFLVSDVVLLFLYFGTRRRKWTRPANLISYYAGVYMIALSICI